jgi:hypothetical protein
LLLTPLEKSYSSFILISPNKFVALLGFAFEEAVKKAQQNADELKALEEQFKTKKTH